MSAEYMGVNGLLFLALVLLDSLIKVTFLPFIKGIPSIICTIPDTTKPTPTSL
jgi:hypothetical protein